MQNRIGFFLHIPWPARQVLATLPHHRELVESMFAYDLVGFHTKGSGVPSMTWPESVDEALCVGWIDGVRRRVDDTRYTIRFTPRKARSTWSAVNVARVAELTREGRMRPAGLAAFERRTAERTGTYAYEQPAAATLDAAAEEMRRAWEAIQARPGLALVHTLRRIGIVVARGLV